ncbi:MAG: hypothetical protein WBW48_03855 [Anaerolineae bacterium]
MKLGIAVVYLFDEQSELLLDVHLGQIEKYTQVPYTIYGSVNRLAYKFRQRLAHHPEVRICECPETNLRGGDEHAYYLDHLVKIAAEDGASHIVTLHLDSFPIRGGWAEELAGRLSESCVIATIERINTACLFFHRDFYLHHCPTFRLSEAECADPKYQQYLKQHNPTPHSGVGYGFMAYSKGLSWYYLQDTIGGSQVDRGKIYDDMIFHLQGAIRLGEGDLEKTGFLYNSAYLRFVHTATSVCRSLMSVAIRKFLRAHFASPIYAFIDRPRELDQAQQINDIKRQLLHDPESYLSLLRGKHNQSRTGKDCTPGSIQGKAR